MLAAARNGVGADDGFRGGAQVQQAEDDRMPLPGAAAADLACRPDISGTRRDGGGSSGRS